VTGWANREEGGGATVPDLSPDDLVRGQLAMLRHIATDPATSPMIRRAVRAALVMIKGDAAASVAAKLSDAR